MLYKLVLDYSLLFCTILYYSVILLCTTTEDQPSLKHIISVTCWLFALAPLPPPRIFACVHPLVRGPPRRLQLHHGQGSHDPEQGGQPRLTEIASGTSSSRSRRQRGRTRATGQRHDRQREGQHPDRGGQPGRTIDNVRGTRRATSDTIDNGNHA